MVVAGGEETGMGGQEAVDHVGRSQTYCVFIYLFLAGAGRLLGPQQVSATTRHSPLCSPNVEVMQR